MKHKQFNVVFAMLMSLSLSLLYSSAIAEETVIKQEKMTYETCLNVIKTSEDKLSITPEIFEHSDEKRLATFKLVDGTLTITCDGQNGLIIVSTNSEK